MLAQFIPLSLSFCQHCLAFAFVSLLFGMVLNLLLLLFPDQNSLRVIFYHSMIASVFSIQCTQLEGKTSSLKGKKERVFTSVPFPQLGGEVQTASYPL